MKKLILKVMLGVALLIPVSCDSVFFSKEDMTPVAGSVTKLQSMHMRTLEVMQTWVESAQGLSTEDRQAALDAIEKDRQLFTGLASTVIETLNKLGDLSWSELAIRMLKEGRDVYDSFKEHFGDLL